MPRPSSFSLYLYIYIVICVAVVCHTLTACSDTLAYYHTKGLNHEAWKRTDTLRYNIPGKMEPGRYHATIDVRLTDSYPYMTLTLLARQTIHGAADTYSDTLTLQVYDDNGRMTGNGLNLIDYAIPLRTYTLTAHDSVTVTLIHIMPGDTLPGISDIGVRLTRE